MTKAERKKLREALHDIMDNEDSDYPRGIALICELLGQRYPAYHDTRELKPVALEDLPLNDRFRYPGMPDE
jgi:hypothetical protein